MELVLATEQKCDALLGGGVIRSQPDALSLPFPASANLKATSLDGSISGWQGYGSLSLGWEWSPIDLLWILCEQGITLYCIRPLRFHCLLH